MVWNLDTSKKLYGLEYGFHREFLDVNDRGHLVVRVNGREIDLYDLVRGKNVSSAYVRILPLIRSFMDLVVDAFNDAVERQRYGGGVYYVYPLKTNTEEAVLETIWSHGRKYGWGFNAGSLPELRAITRFMDEPRLLVIDGVKTPELLDLAERFAEKGWRVIVDVEDERDALLLRGRRVETGIRIKQLTSGSGKWDEATGITSKFGMNILDLEELLDKHPWLIEKTTLLHVHPGSQILDIETLRRLMVEAGRIYEMLRDLGLRIDLLDVGGGLAYPYGPGNHSEPNYTVHDYADAVVSGIKQACRDDCPGIVFEGGRFIVAAHRIVVARVLASRPYASTCRGETSFPIIDGIRRAGSIEELRGRARGLVDLLARLYLGVCRNNLEQRRMIEELDSCSREELVRVARRYLERDPGLAEELSKYMNYLLEQLVSPSHRLVLDFSIFRDMPDYLIVGDYFQPVPLQELDRPPEILAVLSDATCDTMGEITRFTAEPLGDKPVFTEKDNRLISVPGKRLRLGGVPLHLPRGRDYYVAFLDTGAYQDMLAMKHNLLEKPVEIIID